LWLFRAASKSGFMVKRGRWKRISTGRLQERLQ
jgi:hypothetical protein